MARKSAPRVVARLPRVDGRNMTLRHRLAEVIKVIGQQLGANIPADKGLAGAAKIPDLSPRLRQTLHRLLEGDSEKQIASRLNLSRHTVHVYVKALYKRLGVCTRAELLARFMPRP